MNNKIRKQTGLTLVELMVALAIGSFLMIGAIQIYTQSRQAFVVNESIARVQETAQFAMDTIEADLRMASNWGRNSRGLAVEGRSIAADFNPKNLPQIFTKEAAVVKRGLLVEEPFTPVPLHDSEIVRGVARSYRFRLP